MSNKKVIMQPDSFVSGNSPMFDSGGQLVDSGDALSNKADSATHNLMSYTNWSQIGLVNQGEYTIEELVTALWNTTNGNATLRLAASYVNTPEILSRFGLYYADLTVEYTQEDYTHITLKDVGGSTIGVMSIRGNTAETYEEAGSAKLATATTPTLNYLSSIEGLNRSVQFFKTQDGVVTVYASALALNDQPAGNVNLGTLPEGYRPISSYIYAPGGGSSEYSGVLQISNSGVVTLQRSQDLTAPTFYSGITYLSASE